MTAKTYRANYDQAICLCPPDRCSGCVRADVNDTKPVMAVQCAYDCPVAQALTRMGYVDTRPIWTEHTATVEEMLRSSAPFQILY